MTVLKLADSTAEWRQSGADILRELARGVEAGEITEFAIAAHNTGDNCYEAWGHFADRWRLLGALEYAKSKVVP